MRDNCTLSFSGPVHTYPDIFENGDIFLHFQKNMRPHVAFSNRIRLSTRIRESQVNTLALSIEHAL